MSLQGEARRVRVWDPALRVFHWLLAALVILNWLLGQFGPDIMTLHFLTGFAILALLVFRVIWGFVGPEPARFASFIRGPRAILDYLRHLGSRQPSNWPGHNPLGALSVVAMLLALFFQVGTGLISDPDDFINVGPLADQVARSTARKAVGWHSLGSNIILLLVLLHIGVILFYRYWKNEDLVRPMITGWKWVRQRL
ncbi:cytochrome b/b6 domain-containing protein [Paracoccus marinaquae]|uniref:Cytochrome b/b6 domain-containing protein n=1 Tax=Paracoccus marinaquae TaxID=2841926 RepID=A0ABS6AIY4_9RHOB|nr:cytochrome b/b6 domain-containing protein [Paracoccus marinaquae]MBU3029605.1 cytochrome b/b6 domain-containing protein [Paracoccus marinaquae]